MAIKLLFCWQDRYFGEQLNLLLSEDPRSFRVLYFTDPARAADWLRTSGETVDCILGAPGFLRGLDPSYGLPVALGEDTSTEEPLSVNMYQRRQDLVDELKNLLRAKGLLAAAAASRSQGRVIAFFSTQGGAGKTTLAYLTALKAAEQGKTVYLNLEAAPCTDSLYAPCGTVSAEEYLCAVQDREDPAHTLLPALSRNEHDVLVLPTPASVRDQSALTGADVQFLVESILRGASPDWLILDLSSVLNEVSSRAMDLADRVVLVYGDDRLGEHKRRRFLADPAFSSLPCAGKELVAGNRCREKYADGRYDAAFPYSASLASVPDVRAVLRGNPDLEKGCAAILSF